MNLTVANQYIAQMPIEVKDAVFGNVGSIIAFRTSADDARSMLKYVEPRFEEHDLIHMHNRHFIISMTIEGEKVPAFSAISLNLPVQEGDETDYIVEHSRALYASSREVVEHYVGERYLDIGKPASQAPKEVKPAKQAVQQSATPPAPLPEKVETPVVQTQPPEPTQRLKRLPNMSSLAHAAIERAISHSASSAGEPVKSKPAEVPAPAEKPKRKRRRRKRKSAEGASIGAAGSTTQAKPENSEPKPKAGPKKATVSTKPTPKTEAHPSQPQEFEDAGIVHLK